MIRYEKNYVSVVVRFDENGRVLPVRYLSKDGTVHRIEAVFAARPAASLKAGGCGIVFSCRVQDRNIDLFFEQGRWFHETVQGRMNTGAAAYSLK